MGHLFSLNLGTFPQIFQIWSTLTEYLHVGTQRKKQSRVGVEHVQESIPDVALCANLVLTHSNHIVFIVLEVIFPDASSNSKCLGLRQTFWRIKIILFYHLRISSFFFLFLCFVGLSLPSARLALAHSQQKTTNKHHLNRILRKARRKSLLKMV